jgi:hypothetical protein
MKFTSIEKTDSLGLKGILTVKFNRGKAVVFKIRFKNNCYMLFSQNYWARIDLDMKTLERSKRRYNVTENDFLVGSEKNESAYFEILLEDKKTLTEFLNQNN